MPNSYPNENVMESKKTKQNSFVWEWDMTQPAQGSGDGWAVDRPMGGLGRTLIPGQKQLRGKTVKLIMTGSIKRPQLYTVWKKKKQAEQQEANRE